MLARDGGVWEGESLNDQSDYAWRYASTKSRRFQESVMKEKNRTEVSDVDNVYRGEVKTWLEKRVAEFDNTAVRSETPPFPRLMQVEVSNYCNHSCVFCACRSMRRRKQQIAADLFRRLAREGYDLGAREMGMFAGAESMTCRRLEDYVAYAKGLGFEYLYLSTNGALGDQARFKRLIDAGLSSIKFSVNGAPREVYRKIHGHDDFDRVVRNIRFCADYARTLDRKFLIAVSFVETAENLGSFDKLVERFTGVVDEVTRYALHNQSGQMPGLPAPTFKVCNLAFNSVNISAEGYIRACCNDYENYLALEDLKTQSLAEAWHGARYRAFRRRHLENQLAGTLCGNCLLQRQDALEALNRALATPPERK